MLLNQVVCGDCADVMATFPDECIHLTVTSPPYDNLRTYNGYTFNFEAIAQQLFRITKQGGVVVWVVADQTINGSETGTSFKQALYFKEIGFNLHDTMIWAKPGFTATGSLNVRYASTFEYMFVLSKSKVNTFNPIKDRKTINIKKVQGTLRNVNGSMRPVSNPGKLYNQTCQRFNVWNINNEQSNLKRCHPAQFPEQLANDHIISWSNEHDVVLDPFCGSGTTLLAAIKNNRNFIGIDISQEYVDLAKKRIDNLLAQQTLNLHGNNINYSETICKP